MRNAPCPFETQHRFTLQTDKESVTITDRFENRQATVVCPGNAEKTAEGLRAQISQGRVPQIIWRLTC